MNNCNRNIKGFTLIELLVVVAIIGILSTIVVSSLQTSRIKSNDARILSSVNQIRTALEMFYLDNGEYPEGDNEFEGVETWTMACGSDFATENEGTLEAWPGIPALNESFQSDINPYIPGILENTDCDDILYYSSISDIGDYDEYCDMEPGQDRKGYILIYRQRASVQDKFLFWEGDTGDWHCRTHER